MKSAVAGCAMMMSITSTPSKLPVCPRKVLAPSSCCSGWTTKVSSSAFQPVNARAASRMSVLAVVAHAHGEQLHDLAGEVLVRRALHVHPGIEEGEHRRVLRDRDHELAEVAGGVAAEGLVLAQHLAEVAHLVLAGGEMAVPEQRHLLLERALGVEHAIRPPVGDAARLEHARAQPVEELVDHRLQRPVAGRLDLDAERLAGRLRELGGRRPARRKVHETGIVDVGRLERRQVVVGDRSRSRPDARPPARASSPRAPRSPRACRRSPRARADAPRDRSSSHPSEIGARSPCHAAGPGPLITRSPAAAAPTQTARTRASAHTTCARQPSAAACPASPHLAGASSTASDKPVNSDVARSRRDAMDSGPSDESTPLNPAAHQLAGVGRDGAMFR